MFKITYLRTSHAHGICSLIHDSLLFIPNKCVHSEQLECLLRMHTFAVYLGRCCRSVYIYLKTIIMTGFAFYRYVHNNRWNKNLTKRSYDVIINSKFMCRRQFFTFFFWFYSSIHQRMFFERCRPKLKHYVHYAEYDVYVS